MKDFLKLNISRTTWDNWSSSVSKCSARCPESNYISHVGVSHSRRWLARSGQVRVGSGQVWYQNVQLDVLSPMTYHTWGCSFSNPFTTLNPDSPEKCIVMHKFAHSQHNQHNIHTSCWRSHCMAISLHGDLNAGELIVGELIARRTNCKRTDCGDQMTRDLFAAI